MILSKAVVLGLVAQCAPHVAPDTMMAIVQTESARKPWAIGVNRSAGIKPPRSRDEAERQARRLIKAGKNIDMGLAQINSANLPKLGLSVSEVFDPCTNLAAGAKILTDNYRRARAQGHRTPLQAALSAYNTGSFSRGFRNGYVRKVMANAGVARGVMPEPMQPAITAGAAARPAPVMVQAISTDLGEGQTPVPIEQSTPPPAWDVFARASWAKRSVGNANDVNGGTIYEVSFE
ncbi:lytic transglycosylase domain-containing protein [Alterisphingorhabdus coralli]|uniref:Lytic transglycosylase domain-containing protein n=1 Tax=Alterisphingorhabdus coralli TaxID=3071408 RepID=A0AA97F938_9SPHN|nr:lytic transglycosylase domain-containing protein [Parasphingorhabdus sp. SCSIO 66989]WOE76739.1 lytic transglycosylase domain-containing protein [Parasphingorhabdus sp. SCSIO 66989]